MSDQPADLLSFLANPLGPLFAIQHDFRERFQEALVDIIEASAKYADPQERADAMLRIAQQAIDPEEVERWFEAGRPLPRLEAMIGEDQLAQMNMRSLDVLDQAIRAL